MKAVRTFLLYAGIVVGFATLVTCSYVLDHVRFNVGPCGDGGR